jgi:NhaP-type Na+/H+ or K+/H+ antiporter
MEVAGGFGLVAGVLILSALIAGVVERAPLSFPMLFLGLGFLLAGTDVVTMSLDAEVLELVATFTLALVLFLDAVNLELPEVRHDWLVPALALGPGTLLTVLGVAAGASLLVGLEMVPALLVGAILASTDPVVVRDVIRDRRLPRSVRRTLGVEAGTNDIVVLPMILVLIAVATHEAGNVGEWALFGVKLLVVGPLVGAVVGALGANLMTRADERYGIRREYQALYGVGLVLAAFAAGDAVGGDGFLAAFAAGASVTFFNHRLCDCFLEFGQVVAEMAMLVAFVLFGAALSGILDEAPLIRSLALAGLAILVIRPVAMTLLLVIERARLSGHARLFIAWFGPRGLNSLLFALLVFKRGVPGGEALLAVVGVVVLVSVVLHGASATPLVSAYARKVAAGTLDEERAVTASDLFAHEDEDVPRITPDELAERLAGDDPPTVLDVRSRSGYGRDLVRVPGAIRVPPDEVVDWAAAEQPRHPLVVYCN